MKTYKTNESVSYGLYLSIRSMDVRFVGAEGETLEGKPGADYIKVPVLLALLFSPILGGVFVLGFPLIVVGVLIYAACHLAAEQVRSTISNHAHLALWKWEPTAAYLNKTKKTDKDSKQESKESSQQEEKNN